MIEDSAAGAGGSVKASPALISTGTALDTFRGQQSLQQRGVILTIAHPISENLIGVVWHHRARPTALGA